MVLWLQVKDAIEGVQTVVTTEGATKEGILLAVCILLVLGLVFMFRYFKGELRRQENMYRGEIKELQQTIRQVVRSKIKILQNNDQNIGEIKQLFIDTVKEIRGAVANKKTG